MNLPLLSTARTSGRPPMSPRGAVARAPRWTTLAAVACAVLVAACGGKKEGATASQTAAKVNKDEITVHQINYVLSQQRNLRPDQTDAASRQILERLIEQQLALQKAEDQKLDRDARVVQQLEAARREIVARAYLEKLGENAVKPTPEQIRQYYESKPALFKERRIYSLQELMIEARPDQLAELQSMLAAAKNVEDFANQLRAKDYRFSGNQAVRAAEQLPLASVDAFARLKDGQAIINPTPTGAQVVVLAGSRSQPVTEEQARPAIEQFLLNERRRKLVEDDIKAMRAAAKIEYVGKFGEGAASAPVPAATAPGATPAPGAAPATPPASAASGLSTTDITKGMGLK